MAVTFDEAFDRLMGHEGGYVWKERDPGGETNWGISKRSYPDVDIKNLTRDGAKEIYRRDFWQTCGVALDDAVLFQVFDTAVNSGIQTAVRLLQRAVGVADDGHWGPHSQSAYANLEKNDVLLLFLAERLEFMTKLSIWADFGKGWARRIAGNLRYAAKDN
jgi:lysozyme family protein